MNDPIREPPIAGAILFLLAGPILWGGHLLAVYTFHAVACAVGGPWATTIVPGSIVVATLAAAGTLAGLLVSGKARASAALCRPGRRPALPDPRGTPSTVLALTGVLWTGSGALALAPCAQFR